MTRAELEELRLLAEQIGNAVAAGLIDPDDDEARIATLVDRLLTGSPAATIRVDDEPHIIRLDGMPWAR